MLAVVATLAACLLLRVEPESNETSAQTPESLDDVFGPASTSEATPDVAPNVAPTPASVPAPRASKMARLFEKLDFRMRVVSSVYFDVDRGPRKVGRNENRLEFTLAYRPHRHVEMVGNVEPVFLGVAPARELDDLASRQMITPFHVESDAAYVAIYDALPHLDFKIGRQTLVWGPADKFNPTNNINPDDLEDRPLFTEPIANQMIVADYSPFKGKVWFQGVYVPIFYPALLPPSAARALKDPQAKIPFAREADNRQLSELQALLDLNQGLVPDVRASVSQPPMRFKDGQAAFKVGVALRGVDFSVSYYSGRHDIPTPVRADASTKNPPEGPVDEARCCFASDVRLVYPRMQVIGADFSTQLGFLGDMGLWGEAALIFPHKQSMFVEFPIPVDVTRDDGQTNPVKSIQGPTIRSTPFVKATTGFDHSIGKHVYVQAQYLRGFIDDFGAGHIGNYVVGGGDLIFFGRHLILRVFGVVDMPGTHSDHPSFVVFPEILVTPPWGGVTVEAGGFALLGKGDTKFGQPAAGTSIAFMKVTGTF